MTVCVAAIYGKDQGIIAVADKMFTSTPGIITVHEVSENNKIFQLTNKCIAMTAGNVANASSIVSQLQNDVSEDDSIKEVAEKAVKIYQKDFKLALENGALSRWGLSVDTFMSKQKELDQQLVGILNQTISEASIDVELIIAGMDNTGPNLFFIENPGNLVCLNSTGVVYAGSGSAHASLSMVDSKYQKSNDYGKVLYSLFKAKKKAEFNPNVGKYTSVSVLNTGITNFNDDEIKSLNEKHEEAEMKSNDILELVSKELGESLNGNTSTKNLKQLRKRNTD